MSPTLAVGGAAAIECTTQRKDPFDLILVDFNMPDMDGFALVEQLRQSPQLVGAAKMMMMTSAGQRGDAARCRGLGVAAYLTKPVSQSELFEAIARVLGNAVPEGDSPRWSRVTPCGRESRDSASCWQRTTRSTRSLLCGCWKNEGIGSQLPQGSDHSRWPVIPIRKPRCSTSTSSGVKRQTRSRRGTRNWPHLDPCFRAQKSPSHKLLCNKEVWSGRPDLNRGPLAPKASALPGCATPRRHDGPPSGSSPACPVAWPTHAADGLSKSEPSILPSLMRRDQLII
jgi:CheY-like chemotaxis protein